MGHTWVDTALRLPDGIFVKLSLVTLDPASQIGPHTHYTLELSTILSGSGEYRVGEWVYPVAPGDVVLFNNTERHGMWNTGDAPLVNMALEFEPRFVWSNSTYAFDKAFLDVFFTRDDRFCHKLDRENPAYPAISRQLSEIRQEYEQRRPRYETVIKGRLMGLLTDLTRGYDLAAAPTDAPAREYPGMGDVLAHISRHYDEPLAVETLAALMHMSPSYFSEVFRARNGVSPKEYIVNIRVNAAEQQLQNSRKSVLEIAQSCGFNSLSNFYAAFKRITGRSPAQYRAHL